MTDAELERLYDAHASGLFRYATSILKCEADARDVLQEVFIKLGHTPLSELQHERALLYRMVHNLCLDFLRRAQTRASYEQQASENQIRLFAPVADPDAAILANQLEEAMRALPLDQRTVTQLKLWEGLTFEEIAAAQRIPPNTAAGRFRYAMAKLRTLLRPLYEEMK